MFVTMATLGYGDYFPTSYGGKVIGMASCFWGVFTLSTMVIILNNYLDFTDGEKKSYNILLRMKLKDELKISTVNVIMSSQKHKFERSRDEVDFNMLSKAYT
jgi:Ion channel